MNFTIPIPQKVSTNKIYAGMHFRVRTALADLYHSYLQGFPRYKGTYPVQITYRFSFLGRPLDTSNTALMAKLLEDAMVVNGIIVGDGWKTVKRTILESKKAEDNLVEIEIMAL